MYSSVLLAICIWVYGMFRLSKSLRRWEVNSNSQRALTRPGGHWSCEMGWVGEEAYEEARVLSFLLCLVVTTVSVVHPNNDTLGIHVWLYLSTFGLLLSYFLMVNVGTNSMDCIAAAGGSRPVTVSFERPDEDAAVPEQGLGFGKILPLDGSWRRNILYRFI